MCLRCGRRRRPQAADSGQRGYRFTRLHRGDSSEILGYPFGTLMKVGHTEGAGFGPQGSRRTSPPRWPACRGTWLIPRPTSKSVAMISSLNRHAFTVTDDQIGRIARPPVKIGRFSCPSAAQARRSVRQRAHEAFLASRLCSATPRSGPLNGRVIRDGYARAWRCDAGWNHELAMRVGRTTDHDG
jgi:hypothetical protein